MTGGDPAAPGWHRARLNPAQPVRGKGDHYDLLRSGRFGGLPETRRERVEVVLVGHGRQAGEHVAQAGDDERVEDGGAAAGVGVTDKQPVFLPDGVRADGVLDQMEFSTRLLSSMVCPCST